MTATKKRGLLLSALVAGLLLSAGPIFAQDLGNAARQERDRKHNLARHSSHVYTNDDLKRSQILLPADKERMLAARRNAMTLELEAAMNPNSTPADPSVTAPEKSDVLNLPLPIVKFPVIATFADLPPDRMSILSSMKARKAKKPRPKTNDFTLGNTHQKQPIPAPVEQKLSASSPTQVRVAAGDSLWKIAARVFGNGARWREIAAVNPEISNPNLIRTGEWLRLIANDSADSKEVVVRAGDTLSSVAQAELGNARAFPCIAQANPQLQTIDLIYPGETLIVPQSCDVAR
jgi:nucleoid-associated protein YgaU